MTPTPAGRTLLQHARTILAQAERLREDLGAYAGGLAGQVRVLSNTNALTEFLPETLSAFLAAHPQVSVDLEERLSDEIVGLIAEGVARYRHRGRHRRCRAGSRPSRSAPTVSCWWSRRDHPLARRARASLSPKCSTTTSSGSTARARCSASSPTRRRASGRPIRLRVQLRSFDAVCRLVERNVGVGIVPETTARLRREDAWAIRAVELADPWALRDLSICVRDYKALPPYARQLVDHMREERREAV